MSKNQMYSINFCEPFACLCFEPEIGGAVLAMKGNKCFAIASDHRYGGFLTIRSSKEKIFSFGNHLYLGITGLATDSCNVVKTLRFRSNLCELAEKKKITPKKLTCLLTKVLYEKRFGPYIVFPVVAGLETDSWEPFICTMDVIGCQNVGEGYVVAGSCKKEMYGMCEMYWKPNLAPDDLCELISETLMSSCDEDPKSGGGATVYVVEKQKVTIKTLKTRMD